MVAKSKETEAIWRIEALRSVLKEIHSLFIMFHGSIRVLLDKEPGGGLTRSHLFTFIMDYLNGNPFPTSYTIISIFSFLKSLLEITNCQHIKSGLHWSCVAVVIHAEVSKTSNEFVLLKQC